MIMLGESGVGKTSLLLRFSDNVFYENLIGTMGIDYRTKIVELNHNFIKLEIWDTAG